MVRVESLRVVHPYGLAILDGCIPRAEPGRLSGDFSAVILKPGVFSNLILSSPDSTPGGGDFEIDHIGTKAHFPAFAVAGVEESVCMMGEPIGSFGARKLSLLGRQFLSPRAGQTLAHWGC